MKVKLPKLSLVVLIGTSGSGKSTFAQKHFLPTEILSSDICRGLVSDDYNNQAATNEAFEVLHFIARKRLAAGRLTVIDATNVQPEARRTLVSLAREFHVLPVAIVLNLPEKVCVARNAEREDRNFASRVIRSQRLSLRKSLRGLKREGFRHVFEFKTEEEVEHAELERVPLWNDRRDELGPFDFIGDVHGCATELESLLLKLGYERVSVPKEPGWSDICFRHSEGRKAVFVGDLVDRGPRALDVLSITRNMVTNDFAICVPGNHDEKLLRKLRGKNVKIQHGLAETLEDLESVPDDEKDTFKKSLIQFLDGMVSHYLLDDGKVVVAHAGMKEEMQGRGSGKVRSFALFGETTGETDEFGLPVRHNWAADYRGNAMVVYGHTPIPEPEWLNRTINIDTGCVFGGKLTAMRYPEQELVSVTALQTYCEPARPLTKSPCSELSSLNAQQQSDDVLDASDVIGKRIISTALRNNITIREENSAAALEVMSRFAVDPKWLVYLPPTMSPCETSSLESFLEHPSEAFGYYKSRGIERVICQEKHMGSRAVVTVCRDPSVPKERFGIEHTSQGSELGVIVTRTGRRFFNDANLESAMLTELSDALEKSGFWSQFETNWVCLDCELMPWSAKAQDLLRNQYAAVSAAGNASLPPAIQALSNVQSRLAALPETENSAREHPELNRLVDQLANTHANLGKFTDAYREYCWKVDSLGDLKLAPFHILATEGEVHSSKSHPWHMSTIGQVCEHSELLLATRALEVDLTDDESRSLGCDWWSSLTSSGGEGMVVKPIDFVANGKDGLVQPAVKCRGPEYLRIIYGPDYDAERNLTRLRKRALGRKRSLAIREFALGLEALSRFVKREPLRRVHECVFGVLALESEPVDPRL